MQVVSGRMWHAAASFTTLVQTAVEGRRNAQGFNRTATVLRC
jgi:hypothetical protein